jgi:hypothetical protein
MRLIAPLVRRATFVNPLQPSSDDLQSIFSIG